MDIGERVPAEVLVVEDDPTVRWVVERMLRHAGYAVRLAAEGGEALEAVGSHGASLRAVYLDLTLPVVTGADVLARIRELHPALPVVVSSGLDARAIHGPTLEAATVFLPKPFQPDELLAAMTRALED